jgi:DNA polymerase
MALAESPGEREDVEGRPLIGKAGQKFDQLLVAVGLKREDIFCGNIVCCRPPMNRLRDYPDAVVKCEWWKDELLAVRPRILIPMGRYSVANWFPPSLPMEEIATLARAVRWEYKGETLEFVVVGCLHPAYVFRGGGKAAEESIKKSLSRAKEYANG